MSAGDDRAHRVADLLLRIGQVRGGMCSASGWDWRAAGYPYDPDEGSHRQLQKLMRELDAALGEP